MNILLEKLKFGQFDVFPELIHAVSPRCFENDHGEIEEFSFQGNDESGEDREHVKRFLESIEIENGAGISSSFIQKVKILNL